MTKRVVFVSQIVPYPPHGGVLQRGFNLLRELSRYYQVDLLAYVHPDTFHKPNELETSREVLGGICNRVEYFPLWPKRSRLHKVVALAAGLPYPKPFSVLAHKSTSLQRRLAEIVEHDPPDLVHLDTIALAPLRTAVGHTPCVLTHHNIESALMARRSAVESTALAPFSVGLQAMRLDRYERVQSPLFPLNIMVSALDAPHLEQVAPGVRTWVVENGVDTEYFRPTEGQEEPALIYTGGMNMFANKDAVLWFLREIWPLLTRKVPNLKFFAVGQNPPPELLDIAASDPGVEAPGFVDDIRPWVARASVYVVPLRVGGGTRLKVVDAMAQGKAIVSTSVGCEGIRARSGEDLLIADDAQGFAEHVLALLRDPGRAHELGARARALAESDYSWPTLGEKLVAGYERVIAGEQGG
jgi:glycosyltransferase involved in cell wall biosynthesis